jgi:dUTP pyrophosphatase
MSKRTFEICISNESDKALYRAHSTFHSGDSGLDLFVMQDTTFMPGETKMIDLGVSCQSKSFNPCIKGWLRGKIYKYHSYLLMPRSSISKTPLVMRNSVGLIDAAYTGNLKTPLWNTSSEPFEIKRGERYMQLVNGDLSGISFTLVDELRGTSRGAGGFGSTGK